MRSLRLFSATVTLAARVEVAHAALKSPPGHTGTARGRLGRGRPQPGSAPTTHSEDGTDASL